MRICFSSLRKLYDIKNFVNFFHSLVFVFFYGGKHIFKIVLHIEVGQQSVILKYIAYALLLSFHLALIFGKLGNNIQYGCFAASRRADYAIYFIINQFQIKISKNLDIAVTFVYVD